MAFRDRGSFHLPFLRLNWARNGLRFRYTGHTWHIKIPFLGSFSRNVNREDMQQDRWNHPGPGWWEGKRRRRS